MEQNVTFWPLLVILIVLISLLLWRMFHPRKHPERIVKRDVLLPACYAVNSMYDITINGQQPDTPDVVYESYFFWLRFSPDGHVFIRRERQGHICWERFDQNGKSLGLVKKAEIQRMEASGEIFKATAFHEEADGRITAISVIFEEAYE